MKSNNKLFIDRVEELQQEFFEQFDLSDKKDKTINRIRNECYIEAVFEAIAEFAESEKLYTPIGCFKNTHLKSRRIVGGVRIHPKTGKEYEIKEGMTRPKNILTFCKSKIEY